MAVLSGVGTLGTGEHAFPHCCYEICGLSVARASKFSMESGNQDLIRNLLMIKCWQLIIQKYCFLPKFCGLGKPLSPSG